MYGGGSSWGQKEFGIILLQNIIDKIIIKHYIVMRKRRVTGRYMLRHLRRLGLRRTAVGRALGARTPFVPFFSATFFCARKNAPHFSLSGAKKRHIPPER